MKSSEVLQQQFPILPPSAVEVLRHHANGICDQINSSVRQRLQKSPPLDTALLTHSIELLSENFLQLISSSDRPSRRWFDACWTLGWRWVRDGRSFEEIRVALQLGRNIAWRHFRQSGALSAFSPEIVAAFAEAIALYADAIEAAAEIGYSEHHPEAKNELQIQRTKLLRALVGDVVMSPQEVDDVSNSIGWQLTSSVSAVVFPAQDIVLRPAISFEPDILSDLDRPDPCLLVPDPSSPGRMAELGQSLHGRTAVVGPPVPLADAEHSLKWARVLLSAVLCGMIPTTGLIHCTDNWTVVVFAQDINLMRTLVNVRLGHILHLPKPFRDKLTETMLEWLRSGRNANIAATRLHVHPQTVRYRLRQLEELFGPQLSDADAHKDMYMALSAYRLLQQMDSADIRKHKESHDTPRLPYLQDEQKSKVHAISIQM
ncbi:helix-turn-helix domain-containing protein [Nocardia terpenica]|uniref:PucR family transcriptional regulator n=1 Tax=Nocardia terpenica TaxID=455432 RepID=UPI000AB97310|nr:helix-turn-helix domain-containing protein [Nocardia terpenica]NQE91226.1 helix-turn-helix domain-containing protein [Nocardia terpenica]